MRYGAFALLLLLLPLTASAQQRDLDFFIGQALQFSPLLQDLRSQVAVNRLDSLRLRAGLRPQINGTVAAQVAPAYKDWGYDYALTNGGFLTALVSANQTIIGRGNIAAQAQTLHLLSLTAQNTTKTSAQDLRRSVVTQYLTAWSDRQQLDFNREVLELLRREETIMKRLTETSVYRQIDYLTFRTTLQQQELLVLQLDNQWRNDLSSLNYLSGITDTTAFDLPEPNLTALDLPMPEGSAFAQQYQLDSLRIRNSEALIDLAYRPKASIMADAGFNSAFTSRGYRNFGMSVGANLTVPIYDGQQRRMQHDKNVIAEQTRQGYARFFNQQYRQQIAQLRQQLLQTEQLIAQTAEQIKFSRALLDANGKLLSTGDVRIADYLLALNNYRSARNLVTQQRSARLLVINQLNYWSLK